MPSRESSLRQDHGDVLIAPGGQLNANSCAFGKTFNESLGVEEWDNWMRWEGATTDLLPPLAEHMACSASATSSPDTWSIGLEASVVNMTAAPYSAVGEFPFDDAPFELDEAPSTSTSSISSNDVPSYPLTTIYQPQPQHQQNDFRRPYRGFSSLTEAEERTLQGIAMPYQALSHVKVASTPPSPVTSLASASISPSPEPEVRARRNKKRKSVDIEGYPGTNLCQSRKRGHNAIEKRYRTNLNAKIECLRENVPFPSDSNPIANEEDSEAEESKPGQQRYGKAAILTRALDYIHFLESTTQRLGCEAETLKTRVEAFENLVMSGSIVLNGVKLETLRRPVVTRSQTLDDVRLDFQQVKPAPTGPVLKRRGLRQTKTT